MKKMINKGIIMAQLKAQRFVQDLREDNRGVSGIVAAVILVLIALLLAALFWDKLQQWFNSTWSHITNTTNEIQ